MKTGKIKKILTKEGSSIKETMRIIDKNGLGVAFVVDGRDKFLGLTTDGDIRRAILGGVRIDKPVEEIMNKKPILIKGKTDEKEILKLKDRQDVKSKVRLVIPLVDENGKVKDAIFVNNEKQVSSLASGKAGEIFDRAVKKILVIGGAGYLGSVLCRELLDKGYKVRVLDNLSSGDEGLKDLYKNKKFELINGSIENISNVIEAVDGVDAVIHLAAIVGDPACAVNPKETLKINYLATKNIVEICKYFQVNRFIFASSCSVYGASAVPSQKLTEESSLNPVSLYAETKIKCEQSILDAVDENFSPTILRMATLYGYSPNMRFDLAVNAIAANAMFDKKISIFGGDQWRPWLNLKDAAKAYIACLESPLLKVKGEIFNTLSENYKIMEVGRKINSVFPEAKLEVNAKKVDRRDYNVSSGKIARLLSFQPEKKIIDGAAEIKWAVEQGLIRNPKNPKYHRFQS